MCTSVPFLRAKLALPAASCTANVQAPGARRGASIPPMIPQPKRRQPGGRQRSQACPRTRARCRQAGRGPRRRWQGGRSRWPPSQPLTQGSRSGSLLDAGRRALPGARAVWSPHPAVVAASLSSPHGPPVAGPRAWSPAPVRGETAGPGPEWLCSDRPASFCQWAGRTAPKRVQPSLEAAVHLRAEHCRPPLVICCGIGCNSRRRRPAGALASRLLGPWPVGPRRARYQGDAEGLVSGAS